MPAVLSLPAEFLWEKTNRPNAAAIVVQGPSCHTISSCVIVPAFRECTERPREVKYTVAIKPRVFGATASRLLKITHPINWPEEPDAE
jgi:hypothetical protein